MRPVTNYAILQRNEKGYATAYFSGKLPAMQENEELYCRVIRETDNITVIPWTKCILQGDEWSISLDVPEGGLYRFETKVANGTNKTMEWFARTCIVRHFGVGDLYLLTGQSNMAGYGRDAAYDPPCLGVHLYGNNGLWDIAAHPLNDSTDTIYPENAEYASETSPALSFSRKLHQSLGIPIGLIQASLGGSPLSAWDPSDNGTLYRAMMRRIEVVGNVKGVLWYQGCSDTSAGLAESYLARFKNMVSLWRKDLGHVPFLTVQLNRWAVQNEESDRYWGIVRDAQRRAAVEIDGVYVVPAIDCSLNDGIHNDSASNVVIGERLADVALCKIYGKVGMTAPNILSAEYVDEQNILIKFDNAYIRAIDEKACGLNIEDADGLADCVRAVVCDDGIQITCGRKFTLPAKFHALWRCQPPAYVPRDAFGMPMLSCYDVEITEKK